MSDADGTCEYVLDPEDPETWGGKEGEECRALPEVLTDGTWKCPRESIGYNDKNKKCCLFHQDLDKKDSEDVTNRFLEEINQIDANDHSERSARSTQFIGAKFGELTLSNEQFGHNTDTEVQIDLSHARFTGRFGLDTIEVHTEVRFLGATFSEGVQIWNSTFKDDVYFGSAKFLSMSCVQTTFEKLANFSGATFEGSANFRTATFKGETIFNAVEFGITEERTLLASKPGVNFRQVDLTEANFNHADLRGANLEAALLSRATLLGADLRGAHLSGAVLGDLRIDSETKLLGSPENSRDTDSGLETITDIFRREYIAYDPNYSGEYKSEDIDSGKSVYRALEELGRRAARPQLQSVCFVRRQDLQKKQYWNNASDAATPLGWLINVARGSRAKVARATLLYGESPWRVVAWSLGIIFSFALLYPLGGWMKPTDGDPITYAQIAANPAEILNSVYYSTLTYTALGFVDFQPVGFGRLLTTIETALGAVMLALLVFILGRRAAR
ncbi:pentapeptide repeat-containing protein [Halobellus marinus]|uniref:pentapeptide repeat-containing protein n=1 Tax=Halobellus TaxID=1073986 RepID=UPI0028AE6A9C|nr:pentapeptide repeat-containing protein [Halobellus sp. DFY28]